MELSGSWRAHVGDEALTREFADVEYDDAAWAELLVPGHWRSSTDFADTDGPVLYRRRFDYQAPGHGARAWLVFDGVFYLGDIWLNGSYVGNTEGYFFPHAFDVTDTLSGRTEHVLAAEVGCDAQADRSHKRQLTGVLQNWEGIDPDWNPGGLWRPVQIEETGPVRIRALSAQCTEATEQQATMSFNAVLDALEAGPATLRTSIGDVHHEANHTLAAGENRIAWTVALERPKLWWPRALGDQNLCDVQVDVVDEDLSSHRRRFRTGLRQVRTSNGRVEVNGERIFLKGSNLGPTRMALADVTPAESARDVRLAVDAGLDLLRVNGHVARPELYDAADDAGLLLWQDQPRQWEHTRSARKQAARQTREAINLLGHRPSVVMGPLPRGNPSFGRGDGDYRRLGTFLAAWPRMGRFVKEFGAPADPTDDTSQEYQARVIKHCVETLRLLKYRPTGGFCQHFFADAAAAAVSQSVLDVCRVPKQGYDALREACLPVIVVATPLDREVRPGDSLALDVHVVSDLRHPVEGEVSATISWSGGGHTWRWQGQVPADECVRVGTLQAVVPDAPGPLTLDLELTGSAQAVNRYVSQVLP